MLVVHVSPKEALVLRAVEGLMYLAPACSFWLLLGVAVYEWPRMAEANALGLIAAKPLLYLSAAAMGFGVNSLAYIVIQLASSLTLKVSLISLSPSLLSLQLLPGFLRLSSCGPTSLQPHGFIFPTAVGCQPHIVAQSGQGSLRAERGAPACRCWGL